MRYTWVIHSELVRCVSFKLQQSETYVKNYLFATVCAGTTDGRGPPSVTCTAPLRSHAKLGRKLSVGKRRIGWRSGRLGHYERSLTHEIAATWALPTLDTRIIITEALLPLRIKCLCRQRARGAFPHPLIARKHVRTHGCEVDTHEKHLSVRVFVCGGAESCLRFHCVCTELRSDCALGWICTNVFAGRSPLPAIPNWLVRGRFQLIAEHVQHAIDHLNLCCYE